MAKGLYFLALFVAGLTVALAQNVADDGKVCFSTMFNECNAERADRNEAAVKTGCSVKWGAFSFQKRIVNETNELINLQLKTSLQYTLIATHFSGWKLNLPGFANYFNKLADDNWNEAIQIMTHLIERGGALKTPISLDLKAKHKSNETENLSPYEYEALSKALDTEKTIAEEMLNVARIAKQGSTNDERKGHDFEFAHFITDLLSDNHVLRIKHLGNYVKLLYDITKEEALRQIALFKFDREYLK